MNPIDKREIGKTGLRVSQMGFGGAPLSGFRGKIPEQVASATLQAAFDAGLNLFDTSPYYGYGRSEFRAGQFLRDLPRDSYVLSTKVGRWMEPLNRQSPPDDLRIGGLPFQPVFDYSAAGVARSMEQSMMRLGISEIDIIYIHDVDVFTTAASKRRTGATLRSWMGATRSWKKCAPPVSSKPLALV